MLKDILKLQGVKELTKTQQQKLEGGFLISHGERACGGPGQTCPSGYCCGRGQNIRYACVVSAPGGINCL